MNKHAIEEMSDAELLEICRSRGWERWLDRRGCTLGWMFGLSSVYAFCHAFMGPYPLLWVIETVILGPFAAFFFFILIHGLSNARSDRYLSELHRRYGQGDLARYILVAENRLKETEAPDWIFLLEGNGLPHGDCVYIEIELWTEDREKSSIRQKQGPRIHRGELGLPSIEVTELKADLHPEDHLLVAEFLTRLGSDKLSDMSSNVRDGFPCSVAVIGRSPASRQMGRCNVAALKEEKRDLPTVALALMMLKLRKRVEDEPIAFGWCSETGEIGLGEG